MLTPCEDERKRRDQRRAHPHHTDNGRPCRWRVAHGHARKRRTVWLWSSSTIGNGRTPWCQPWQLTEYVLPGSLDATLHGRLSLTLEAAAASERAAWRAAAACCPQGGANQPCVSATQR